MTIKKLMMAAGAVDGPQEIAPSSNDWDYSFDGGGEWPVAGNTLGDHTIGGYIDNTGGDSAISCLITFDGDFEIEWTATALSASAFGVHALTDDDHRTTGQYLGAKAMTNSFSWIHGGTNPKDFFIGSTAQSDTNDFADGSVIKIERVSGTITIYDDDVSVHVFGTTYSGAMRFWLGAGGAPFAQNYDNIKFTDTEKVQRDGQFDENQATSRSFGHGPALDNMGTRFIATRSGSVTSVKCNVHSVSTGFTAHAEMWLGTSTSPTSQVGSDSNTQSFASTGDKTFTFTDVTLQKGQVYWLICVGPSTGTGDVSMKGHTAPIGDGAYEIVTGRHSTITSITDNIPQVMAMEVVVDTSDGEPTPDHETLLLIQDEGANDSQTFSDSSQLGLTCTANNQVHWDNVQNLGYGTTAIYVDGSDDHISLADHDRWSFPGDFTIDLILRCTDVSIKRQIYEHRVSAATGNHGFNLQIDTAAVLQFYANASGGAVSALCGAISNNTNHHVCAVRSGNRLGLALDGTFGTVVTLTGAINNISTTLKFGSGVHVIADFIGWMKRIRITNDARWEPGVNFTPPSGNYPVG